MNADAWLPVPYFRINRDYEIVSMSREASALFPNRERWMDLVDEGSRDKAFQYVQPVCTGMNVELTLHSRQSPFVLADVYQTWDEAGTGHLVCLSSSRYSSRSCWSFARKRMRT